MCEIDADHVLDELAEIAFAVPGEEGGLPVKVADKLRALEKSASMRSDVMASRWASSIRLKISERVSAAESWTGASARCPSMRNISGSPSEI